MGLTKNYHFDSRGSTVAITDATGTVTDRFEYGPYGESLNHSGTTDTPFNLMVATGFRPTRTGFYTCGCATTTQRSGEDSRMQVLISLAL
jgi:hypothetical protein